jgi:rhodanese-related sulfurtransferase
MTKKSILQDILKLWLLLAGCLLGGLLLNEMRPKPLAIFYTAPTMPVNLAGDVATAEMEQISASHAAVILDARPEIFYRLGHIPNAFSLPRDDFENQYRALQSFLASHKENPLIVYCSGSECHDSRMVADDLEKLGFAHVRLFRGGWTDWESANLPVEKAEP